MREMFAGVAIGVVLNEEQDARLFGRRKQSGVLEKYEEFLRSRGQLDLMPSYGTATAPDFVGFFLFSAGRALVDHYIERGLIIDGAPRVVVLPDSAMSDTHLAGLQLDAYQRWIPFEEFCAGAGLHLGVARILLVVDESAE
jgi:hypothetical protein